MFPSAAILVMLYTADSTSIVFTTKSFVVSVKDRIKVLNSQSSDIRCMRSYGEDSSKVPFQLPGMSSERGKLCLSLNHSRNI